MSVEIFFNLKEIDSLSKMKINLLIKKAEQEARVLAVKQHIEDVLSRQLKLKEDHLKFNEQLAELEDKIKTSNQQKKRLEDTFAPETKIQHYADELNSLEEQGLDLLDKIELGQSELNDTSVLLKGLEKSILEISEDSSNEINMIKKEIDSIDFRLASLESNLPPEFKSILQKVSCKNLTHGPFTRIENHNCFFCRYKVSRVDESLIDQQKNLLTCAGCGRIFLPYGA